MVTQNARTPRFLTVKLLYVFIISSLPLLIITCTEVPINNRSSEINKTDESVAKTELDTSEFNKNPAPVIDFNVQPLDVKSRESFRINLIKTLKGDTNDLYQINEANIAVKERAQELIAKLEVDSNLPVRVYDGKSFTLTIEPNVVREQGRKIRFTMFEKALASNISDRLLQWDTLNMEDKESLLKQFKAVYLILVMKCIDASLDNEYFLNNRHILQAFMEMCAHSYTPLAEDPNQVQEMRKDYFFRTHNRFTNGARDS
jgi:hypothetical protein